MKDTIIKIIKFFLIGVVVILIILFAFALVFMLDWPWWAGFFLLLGIIGLVVGALFLRKLMKRRNEQRFVQQVIEQDESLLKKLGKDERDELKELQNKWKEAVDTLRRSHLKKMGNPLYVLPWYLVLGESGSGKTTAINSARLSSPFAEVNRASGISGTRSCDWWFFEQAIIIDTAGRYAVPVDDGRDREEWQRFLSLLVKYRSKEPIHGLIVTVAADKLQNASAEELEEDGRKIRRRVDELMRVLGIKFPIYMLITKCDRIRGMTQFCDRLPELSIEQPMGVVNQDMSKEVSGFMERVVSSVGERLRNLRLLLLHQPESGPVDSAFFLFPEEFENLKKGLDPFIKSAFQENPYQDTPLLRGIYFSSGRQEGTPYSHFLNALGLISDREVLPDTGKGLFLHDFFSKILPTDRGLLAPTKRAIEWRMITRNLGLTSWVLLCLALCGLLSYSFVKNLSTIRKASHVAARPLEFRGDYITDSATMERYRLKIKDIEEQNRNWWTPRFGLNESRKVEAELKAQYCRQFRERFLAAYDKQMGDAITGFAAPSSDDVAGRYIVHLVRRINLLKTRLNGADLAALKAKPLPAYVFNLSVPAAEGDAGKIFGGLYLDYLLWRSNTSEIEQEISVLQTWLRTLYVARGAGFQWLVNWANRDGSVSPVTLRSFWGGSLVLPDEQNIAPAFTRKGKGLIDSFMGEMKTAYPDPAALERDIAVFGSSYRSNCFAAWQSFAIQFPRGAQRLKDAREWQQVAAAMATDQGPYFAFINRMTSELEPLIANEGMPDWLQQAYQYQVLKSKAVNGTVVTRTAGQGQKMIGKLETMFGGNRDSAPKLETQLAAAKAIQDYRAALSAVSPISQSRAQAYQMTLQVFSEDQVSSKSPFYVAVDAAARFRSGIDGGSGDGTFWNLFTGPVNFMWSYARAEAACTIQQQWEEKVLQEAQGAVDQQAMQYLLNPDGPVWKFAKGPAAPFLGWSPRGGYYSKVAMGGSIPFESSFFSFLSKGAHARVPAPQRQNRGITIKGLPTDANPDARIKPQSTRLELQCDSGGQVLENLNFPISRTFAWSAETCGDVILQIEVGNLVLTRRYGGPQAFPDFLQSFPGGRHTFSPHDFPSEKVALERMGIKFIRVNYHFSGVQAITGQAKSLPGQAPAAIVRCWN